MKGEENNFKCPQLVFFTEYTVLSIKPENCFLIHYISNVYLEYEIFASG